MKNTQLLKDALLAVGCNNNKVHEAAISTHLILEEMVIGERPDANMYLFWSHAFGQGAHESSRFAKTEENLYYSADRLMQVWPSRFKTRAEANLYAKNPEKLANYVYGGRMGNNSEGDGFKFRGRGWIGLTGKDNYAAASEYTGIDLLTYPEKAAEFNVAFILLGWFLTQRKSKTGTSVLTHILNDDIRNSTRFINGGTNGLADRELLIKRAKGALYNRDLTPTWNAIPNASDAIILTPPSAPQNTDSVALWKQDITPGYRGEEAAVVQQMLADLGYPVGKVDGDYGRNSSKAMAEFQSENGLSPTGNVTLNDFIKLKEVYHITIENFPFEGVVQRGSRGEYVYRLQILLNKRGFPCGEPDGAYGPGTATAVAMLQTRSGMQATGVMDEPTLVALKGFKA